MPVLFLTGLARSGTTWAAQGIAALTRARYVHEPFNRVLYPELARYDMLHQPANSCDPDFVRILDEKLRPRYRRPKVREFLLGRNLVFKDVPTSLAAECIQAHLDAHIVILTRHPCAMGASWKVRGWIGDLAWRFDVLLQQATLLHFLAEFQTHMRSSNNFFFQFGAYWGAMYYVLRRLASLHPEWQWIVHDHLCQDPVDAFGRILHAFDMPVRRNAADFFRMHDRPPQENETPYQTYRETKLTPEKWKTILSTQEAQALLDGAEPFRPDELLLSSTLRPTDALVER
jgi:hypothetical protein